MKPRRLGDGLLYVFIFAGLVVFFLSIGLQVQDNVTNPVEVPREIHSTNVSENGSHVIQLDNVGEFCLQDSIEVWDPSTNTYLEKPFNYTVESYEECRVNITDYYSEDPGTHDAAFSYTYAEVDSGSTLVMDSMINLANVLAKMVPFLVFFVLLVLGVPRIIRALKEGRGGTASGA